MQRTFPLKTASLWLVLGFLAPTFLHAGTITLDTQVDTSVQGGTLQATLRVTNRGDEAARNIQFKMETPIGDEVSSVSPQLAVGQNRSVILRHSVKTLLPGRHPLIVRTLYTDTNLYAFSALAVSYFIVGQDTAPGVLALLSHATLEKHGSIHLRLKNLDKDPKTLHVHLLLPQELSTDKPLQEIPLSLGQETDTDFSIRNFSALDNSTYAVFTIIEYDRQGMHYMAVAPGEVEIRSGILLQQFHGYLFLIFTILLILFIAINLYVAWKRQIPLQRGK